MLNYNSPLTPDKTSEKVKDYAIASMLIVSWGTLASGVLAIALKIIVTLYVFIIDTLTSAF